MQTLQYISGNRKLAWQSKTASYKSLFREGTQCQATWQIADSGGALSVSKIPLYIFLSLFISVSRPPPPTPHCLSSSLPLSIPLFLSPCLCVSLKVFQFEIMTLNE